MRAPAAAFASVLSVRSSAKSVPTISAALMTMVATVAAGRSFDGAWYRPARRSRVCAHRSPSMHAGARNRLLRGGVGGAGLRRRVHRGDSLVSSAASSARMVARRSARRRRCGGGSARALANARGARRARRRAANRHRLSHSQARSRPARVRVSSPGLRSIRAAGSRRRARRCTSARAVSRRRPRRLVQSRVVCGRGRNPTLSASMLGMAPWIAFVRRERGFIPRDIASGVERKGLRPKAGAVWRFSRRGPSRPARATGPQAPRTGRASRV